MFIGKLEYYGHVETAFYTRLDARPPTPERRKQGTRCLVEWSWARLPTEGGRLRLRPSASTFLPAYEAICLLQENYSWTQIPCSTSCKANLPSYLLLKVKLAGDAEASGDVKGQDNVLPVEHRKLLVHAVT